VRLSSLTLQKTTRYQRCICHGLLTASLISAVAAQSLPGPGSIYLTQSLQFRLPVYVDDTVTAYVRVKAIDRILKPPRATFDTICVNQQGQVVIRGEAVVTIPPEGLPSDE
jgi:3-hydroxybutyryl-CoA dehydratase